jgi:hypothetical protein
MPRKTLRYKGFLTYELDYDYLAEKMLAIITVASVIVIAVIISNWPYLIVAYGAQALQSGLSPIAYALLYTILAVFLVAVGAIAPHFTESIRPKGFKKITEKRRLEINFYVMVSLLALVSVTVLALSFQYLPS